MASRKGIPQPRKRLTAKQKKLVKAYVVDPTAKLKDLADTSGYAGKTQVFNALQSKTVQDELVKFRELMEQREKLSLGKILDHLEDGLEATEVRAVKLEGSKFKVSAETKDFTNRGKYLDRLMELRGLTKSKSDVPPSGPVNVAIVLMGGGSEAEKAAVADAMLAARLSRGLHPIENRPLTPEEAEQYQRRPP